MLLTNLTKIQTFELRKQNKNLPIKFRNKNEYPVSMNKTKKINFPSANYKEFSLSDNTNSLDPKIATPKIVESGMQHLEIIQKKDGYASVRANFLAVKINVPLGWESIGGFDAFDKIFFYPKGGLPGKSGLPLIFISLKILEAEGIGNNDFASVLKKADDIYKKSEAEDPAYKNRILYSDPANKTFAFEVKGIKNAISSKRPKGTLDIYMQDSTPGSTLWADFQLSVPAEEFEKYKGLYGLMYKDLQINWDDLAKIAAQSK